MFWFNCLWKNPLKFCQGHQIVFWILHWLQLLTSINDIRYLVEIKKNWDRRLIQLTPHQARREKCKTSQESMKFTGLHRADQFSLYVTQTWSAVATDSWALRGILGVGLLAGTWYRADICSPGRKRIKYPSPSVPSLAGTRTLNVGIPLVFWTIYSIF